MRGGHFLIVCMILAGKLGASIPRGRTYIAVSNRIWKPPKMHWKSPRGRRSRCLVTLVSFLLFASPAISRAEQASISAWDAAEFRVWGYIPYWASSSQISGFASNGMYSHVSNVLYFGAVRPDSSGNLSYGSSTYQTNLNTLRSQSSSVGFNLHL